jgi:TPR repeat protein
MWQYGALGAPFLFMTCGSFVQGMRMTNKYLIFSLSLLLLASPAAFAGFDEANAAFEAGDYTRAQAELKPLLDQHDPRAQYAMGVLFENGLGVNKDLSQAAAWYLKAAEQGNSDAQYNLGAMNEHGVGMPVNYAEAARWYLPAAEIGDIDALSNLGVLYQNGQGVKQDKVLAMALYNVSVAYAGNGQTRAAQNRQGLANQMPLEDVQKALALTEQLLKPGHLKPGLENYIGQVPR